MLRKDSSQNCLSSLFKSKGKLDHLLSWFSVLLQDVRDDGFWVAPVVTCFGAAAPGGEVHDNANDDNGSDNKDDNFAVLGTHV